MTKELLAIDEVLDDEELVDSVFDKFGKRFVQSRCRGRKGTPAEVALRMLVLKHLRRWSYEELEWETSHNLVYKHFCRLGMEKSPDAKTMVRLGQLLGEDVLRLVFDRIVELSREHGVTKGRKMRVDTTVVETPIRYPSDSRLCEDVTEVACREIDRMRRQGVAAPRGFRNVRRSIRRRQREIQAVARRRSGIEAKRRALKKPYGRLLATTRRVLRQAARLVHRGTRMGNLTGKARRSLKVLKHVIRMGKQVVAQTGARIFRGVADSASKIVSIFEPATRILRRGKAHKPTEFGQMVKVQEAEGGIVTDIAVVTEHDALLLVPSVEKHTQIFGRVPRVVATDRGFFSQKNVERVEALGVKCAAIPKPGHRSKAWLERERSRPFRKARAWRAGGEARISRLKHTFGMHRTRYKGPHSVARSAFWAGIANNLLAIARHPIRTPAPR